MHFALRWKEAHTMRNDVRLDGWLLHADGPCQDDFLESIFFTGNGRMGVRGYVAGDPSPAL